jgi:hypothetical protein
MPAPNERWFDYEKLEVYQNPSREYDKGNSAK